MAQYTTNVTSKGQVTIPVKLRRALNIKPKDRVAFELIDGEIRLRPAKSVIEANYGAVKPINRPEDFHKMRQEMQDDWAEEVWAEG